jgi:hypothetical protein
MTTKIVAALNDLPESQPALRRAIEHAELATVSVLPALPAYISSAIVVDPTTPNEMKEYRRRAYSELHEKAALSAKGHVARAKGSIVDGRQVQAIPHFFKHESAAFACYWPSSAQLLFIQCLEFGL